LSEAHPLSAAHPLIAAPPAILSKSLLSHFRLL
jgi:hypothetical protein